jgi:hypothetical protein
VIGNSGSQLPTELWKLSCMPHASSRSNMTDSYTPGEPAELVVFIYPGGGLPIDEKHANELASLCLKNNLEVL